MTKREKIIKKVLKRVESFEKEMTSSLLEMCKIPAIGPLSRGNGEVERSEFLINLISDFGFDEILPYNTQDDRVPSGYRPNIVAKLNGENCNKTIWIVVHMDTVPSGDVKEWETDPFKPVIRDNCIYGRGVEDNGQELIAALYAVKALTEEGVPPCRKVCIAIVADEEEGSRKGIQYLLRQNLFKKSDLIIVPDSGTPKGDAIEIAEKSRLIIKFTTRGIQCHASRPHKGINALKVASEFLCKLYKTLYSEFDQKDTLFEPPHSTFEPTRRDLNLPNLNTIPGEDIFYMDCRILPHYDLERVLLKIEDVVTNTEKRNVKLLDGKMVKPSIDVQKIRYEKAAPPTQANSPVVQLLKRAIQFTLNLEAKIIGIGSGTCAVFFRNAGYDTAVWATVEQTAHQSNEFIKISNMMHDCKVFTTLLLLK